MTIHFQAAMPTAPLFRRKVKLVVPEGTTVEALLPLYEEKYKANGLFRKRLALSILVNGSRAGLRTELHDRDRVTVFQPMHYG